MGSRPAAFVRIILLVLAAAALAACLGAAAPASAGPGTVSPVAAPALRALLAAQQAQLTAADGAAGDYFGYSVAISGTIAVVGAVAPGGVASGTEGAYVFVRSGTTWSRAAEADRRRRAPSDSASVRSRSRATRSWWAPPR